MNFKKKVLTKAEQIENAKQIAYKAVDMFKQTLLELDKSNDELLNIIDEEEKQIEIHKQNIQAAGDSILSNQYVIAKLSDFIPNK